MIRRTLPLLALLGLAVPVCAEAPKREGFELAIDNALSYLAGAQNPDGSWVSGGFGGMPRGVGRDPAVTALCVMAFLSAGHVPGEGKHGTVIEKGINFVCSQQAPNGLFAGNQGGPYVMYTQGICTLMAAEAVGLLPDRRQAASLRKNLELGVKLIKACQSAREGGWRHYQPSPASDADMSVTGWQVMALRAAKNVGCDVNPTVIDRAVEYVKRSREQYSGGYRYTPIHGQVTIPCTGAAILSLELCGKEYHKSAESLTAADYIKDKLVADFNRGNNVNHFRQHQHFFYGVYYASQAMFQIGGGLLEWYRSYLHWLLLHPDANAQKPSGFWTAVSPDDNMAGVNYCTSMAVLAMTVEYRFLPIYQRGEEPEERGDK